MSTADKRSSVKRFKLERIIKELKSKEGRGTELISLYIPAGRAISEVIKALREEYGTASNIKSDTTRHHVLDAITTTIQRLKLFNETPPNGLAVFCGYVSGTGPPGSEKLEVYVIEPPEPIKTYLYRCDSHFHVTFLEEMIAEKEVYGLLVMDRSEAVFATLKGRRLDIIGKITSGVPGKHSSGGQSARRFERVIEQLAHEFYKRIGEYSKKLFGQIRDLKGLLIGGPGPTKNTFLEGEYLPVDLKNKVVGVIDVGYTGEEGIYELVKRGRDVLRDLRYVREKEILTDFLYHVAKKPELTSYGYLEVLDLLNKGMIKTLFLSEDANIIYVSVRCSSCGWHKEAVVKRQDYNSHLESVKNCPLCGGTTIISSQDALEYFIELGEKTGAQVEVISTETEEGQALKESFGGVAAILRWTLSKTLERPYNP
ncbi:MAG: peptide chain release factor aRF-1 [Candidatus Nezhaarchaeales archaeon]